MGWTSTGDPYANVGDAGLSFDSEEAAKEFAEKHGWEYTVNHHYLKNWHYSYCIYVLSNFFFLCILILTNWTIIIMTSSIQKA